MGLLFALTFGLSAHAYENVPYKGDYSYNTSLLGDVFHLPDGSDEGAIVSATLAKMLEGSQYCALSVGAATSWVPSVLVEGIESSATRKYPVNATLLDGNGVCAFAYPRPISYMEVSRHRLVCSSAQRFRFGVCINGSMVDVFSAGGGNFGPPCEQCTAKGSPHIAKPIEPGSGNMWHQFTDIQAAGSSVDLSLMRTYNSLRSQVEDGPGGAFGRLWSMSYAAHLRGIAPQLSATVNHCWKSSTQPPFYDCGGAPVAQAIPDAVMINRGDGKSYSFNLKGGVYVGGVSTNDRVTALYSVDGTAVTGWIYTAATGDVTERYDGAGYLLSITDRAGKVLRLTYSAGTTNDTALLHVPLEAPACTGVQQGAVLAPYKLMCVTDSWGRQINFRYDAGGRISEAIDPAGASHWYEYDGISGGCTAATPDSAACSANNLTKVTHPDGSSQTYLYNEAARINDGAVCTTTFVGGGVQLNALTGVIDENGDRFMSWTYDCNGRATVSELASGINKVVISYQDPYDSGVTFSTVKHTVGPVEAPQTTSSNFSLKFIDGVAKNTAVSATCAECGIISARTYDANANVASVTTFNGTLTTYAYDLARNLETRRVEANGTTVARTITTTWHPTFRLPAQIAAPKLLTSYTYDANGNLLTRTEQATTDLTGSAGLAAVTTGTARVWTRTYNASGQVLTETGPRTDIVDVTTYGYDEAGNLRTITNALGHVTTFADYDSNGRPGRIDSPNGATTTLTYSPRGWLDNVTIAAGGISETTIYEHDGVGQLKKVTAPDGSIAIYSYDAAHRLTGIADGVGNRITYTLDLTGNRIKEQVSDPGGTLARNTSRVYDTLNRLQQQTGGAQ